MRWSFPYLFEGVPNHLRAKIALLVDMILSTCRRRTPFSYVVPQIQHFAACPFPATYKTHQVPYCVQIRAADQF